MKIRPTDLDASEIAAQLSLKPFQGRQVFHWIHKKRVFDFQQMTDLSKELRRRLTAECEMPLLAMENRVQSIQAPGTWKALFRLQDGNAVESVIIRDADRVTFCLSTQVGCAIRCAFCATGRAGFSRNLSAGEIVEQALHLIAAEDLGSHNPNIVYMGMGEPFRNYEAVVRSIRLLSSIEGLHVGARRITVSTAGDVEGIRRFAREGWQVRLSVSLHAASDELRSELVPLNHKYPLGPLMQAVKDYIAETNRQVTFEWILLDGVNDSPEQALALVRLIRSVKCAVNLIPYNPAPGAPFRTPSMRKCLGFQAILAQEGIPCTLRKERGTDIDAACGQLAFTKRPASTGS